MRRELEMWIDDPPRVVLTKAYLDAIRALPVGGVAVMLDGPAPGLKDARWSGAQLEELARRLPNHRRTLTAWASPDARAVAQLERELPDLLRALDAEAVELDVEPAGEWRESDVAGFVDRDLDGARLDDAAAAIAAMLLALPVGEIEVTTFPGALRVVEVLVDELAARAPAETVVRLWLQIYPVLTRGGRTIGWNDALGPVRWPREGLEKARGQVPDRVEVCAGLSAYDSVFPGHGESMAVAAESALLGGSPRLRWWSSKWLCRKEGRVRRAGQLDRIAAALEAHRPTPPAPAPDLLMRAVEDLHRIAASLKEVHPKEAAEVAQTAGRLGGC